MRLRLLRPLATLLVLASSLTVAWSQPIAVRFNEILADNTQINNAFGERTAMVELYNAGTLPADLANLSISDLHDYSYPGPYVFPPGVVLAPGAYLVLACDVSYANMTGLAAPLRLRPNGGTLTLFDDDHRVIDYVQYGLQVQDHSLVRIATETWSLGVPSFGATNTTLSLGNPQVLRINEWMAYQSSSERGFFELFNPGPQPVALARLLLSSQEGFPNRHVVAPLSFIGTGAQAYAKFIPQDCPCSPATPANEVNVSMGLDDGEINLITLYNDSYEEIHRVSYTLQAENVSEGFLPDGNTNRVVHFPRVNDRLTRSPGKPNFLLLTNLFVNELLSNPISPQEDALELINSSGTNLDIGGWWLSNQPSQPKKYLLPVGTFVPAQGFCTLYEGAGTETGFNGSSAAVPFHFDGLRDGEVVLSQTDSNGNLTGYQVLEDFGASAPGLSFGRFKTSVPEDYKFVAMTQPSFGADNAVTLMEFRTGTGLTNALPEFGPVVISEIMYAPSNSIYFIFTNGWNLPVFGPNPVSQFIELHNASSEAVPLYDTAFPSNRWRFQNAVSFVFPQTNLAANSFCLVVGFTPTNGPLLTNFRNRYRVPTNAVIFGPWNGVLADNMAAVELARPGSALLPPQPDASHVPYFCVDKAEYGSAYVGGLQRWARAFEGMSLQRKHPLRFGNDPFNWAAANPTTPGAAIQDSDNDGIPDVWEIKYGFNPTNASDAMLDPDHDQSNNLEEFVAGSNPTNGLSVLRVIFSNPQAETFGQFLAYSNTSYQIEYRDALSSPWKKLSDVAPASSNRVIYLSDDFQNEQRYYRVAAPATN